MILPSFVFAFSICFISWIVGLFLNAVIMKMAFYQRLSNFNFIRSKAVNNAIGLPAIKWIIKNTPFKLFNPALKLEGRAGLEELTEMRKQMTYAETGHLIGFNFVVIVAVVMAVQSKFLLALIILIVNLPMNLYPSLLQQENKRRIDRLIAVMKRRAQ